MLLVFLPVADVGGAVGVSVFALAMSHIVEPGTLVDVSVSVNQPALSIGLVLREPALIHGTIFENLLATALAGFLADDPLPLVFALVRDDLLLPEFQVLAEALAVRLQVVELTDLLEPLRNDLVFKVAIHRNAVIRVTHLETLLHRPNLLASKMAPPSSLKSYDRLHCLRIVGNCRKVEHSPATSLGRWRGMPLWGCPCLRCVSDPVWQWAHVRVLALDWNWARVYSSGHRALVECVAQVHTRCV